MTRLGATSESLHKMNFYLQRFGFQGPFIEAVPHQELGLIVVIPCYNETNLIASLEDLFHADDPKCAVEIIVVINASEAASDQIKAQNDETYHAVDDWRAKNQKAYFSVHQIFTNNLPKKHAGVGFARKIGMDEAVYRFEQNSTDGIIVCFDADSKCDTNYLVEIETHFKNHPKSPGCSIHYEHPLTGNAFDAQVYQGIIGYELHLRYYNQALKFCGLPYAFHTVGSSMAVRSSAYQKQGGMNRRKAGEDFYFLHKIIELGGFTEIKSTRVIPSPRISDRVPFGTGKAIGDWVAKNEEAHYTYGFDSFLLIRRFVEHIPQFYSENFKLDQLDLQIVKQDVLIKFLSDQEVDSVLEEVRTNSKTQEAFTKRFFKWFDAFQVLKLVHFLRDNGIPNGKIEDETAALFKAIGLDQCPDNKHDQLLLLREIEKK